MESPSGRLCADPVFGSHNADLDRDFAQRFTESGGRAPIAIGRRCDRSLKMRYARELPFRLMHRPGLP
jgi:hypothetical protein